MRFPIEVHNKFLPFPGFSWMTWLVFCFTRKPKDVHLEGTTRRHELVHVVQQGELSVLFTVIPLPIAIHFSFAWWAWTLVILGILFAGWICYGISNAIEYFCPPFGKCYYYTCWETEAYNHEDDPGYLRRRIPIWGSLKHIPNRLVRHK